MNAPRTRSSPNPTFAERIIINKVFQQGHLLLGKSIPGVHSTDRYGFSVLNTLLGDGMSSRLYQRVRERAGLAYSVYTSLQPYPHASILAGNSDPMNQDGSVIGGAAVISGSLADLARCPGFSDGGGNDASAPGFAAAGSPSGGDGIWRVHAITSMAISVRGLASDVTMPAWTRKSPKCWSDVRSPA